MLGKALLATLPISEQPPTLRRELRQVNERGWATDHEENEDGSWCVGVAIWQDERAIAALSLSAPSSRMNATLESEMGTALIGLRGL